METLTDLSPEGRAIAKFEAEREEYASATRTAVEIVREKQPITFGEVLRELARRGFDSHISAQALDAESRRSLKSVGIDNLVVRDPKE